VLIPLLTVWRLFGETVLPDHKGYNNGYQTCKEHGITPQGIKKAIKDITERVKAVAEAKAAYSPTPISREEVIRLIKDLEAQMRKAAKSLEFEKAALLHDRIIELRKDEELLSPLTRFK